MRTNAQTGVGWAFARLGGAESPAAMSLRTREGRAGERGIRIIAVGRECPTYNSRGQECPTYSGYRQECPTYSGCRMGILARRCVWVLERLFKPALLLLLLAAGLHPSYGADRQMPDILRSVGFDQRLNEQVPLDLQFTDETGHAVKLGDYFGKKPVVMVLAYYKCPMLCTVVLNGLVQAMRSLAFTAGKEFNVVTVSFDPRETADLAAAKKKTYLARYGRPGAAQGWHFLTGKPEAIKRLTGAVGFRYVYDAVEDQYIHTSGIMILTPQGKISRYFYGIQLPARDLRLGLVEASADKIGPPTDQVLLYCFHYDPAAGKYSSRVLNMVRTGGALTVVALAGMVWFLWRRGPRKASRANDADDPPVGSALCGVPGPGLGAALPGVRNATEDVPYRGTHLGVPDRGAHPDPPAQGAGNRGGLP